MSCLVTRNKETGAIEKVLAPNGQESLLYSTLLKENSGNAEQALRQYAIIHTPSFNEMWKGENEPTIEEYKKTVGNNISLMPSVVPPISEDEVPRGGLTKLIHLKSNLLHNANQRLSEVRASIKESKADAEATKNLSKQKTDLTKYIEDLEGEITRLKGLDSKEPELISPFIDKELERLDQLLVGNTKDISEAAEIIRFIRSLADLRMVSNDNNTYGHPLFDRSELFNETGEFSISPAIENIYKEWDDRAKIAESKMLERSRILFTEIIGENEAVEKMYGEGLNYDDIVKTGKGMKDTNWWDMMLMDIGTGIFSKNGIIPQVAKIMINEEFEKQASWSKGVNEQIDEVLPEARKILERLGHIVKIPGIRNVNYDLYRQIDKQGNLKPNIVNKFSFEYQDELEDMERRVRALRNDAISATGALAQKVAFNRMFNERNRWLKNNTHIVNPALIEEIISDPEFIDFFDYYSNGPEVVNHTETIKNLVGAKYYNKVVEEQKDKIRQYVVQRQHALDEIMATEGVINETSLSSDGKFKMKVYDYENNPFSGAVYSDSGVPFKIGTANINAKFDFNVHLPQEGKGYYDANYATIERHEPLLKLYDAFYKITSEGRQRVSAEAQRGMLDTSIAGYEKTMLEMFLDKDVSVYQKLSKAMRGIVDSMKNSFGINKQDAFNFAKINTITGLPEYTINESFLQQNQEKIKAIFKTNSSLFLTEFNREATVPITSLTKFTSIRINSTNRDRVLSILSRYTRTSSDRILSDYAKVFTDANNNTYQTLPVGKILYAQALHEVAQNMSFDLPKVMKMYSNNIAQYTARNTVLPTMELMKSHYDGISKQATNNVDEAIQNAQNQGNNRLNAIRTNAVKQYDDWFHRVVLGNYGLRKNYGFINVKEDNPDSPTEKKKVDTIMRFMQDGKLRTEEERKLTTKLDKAILAEQQALNNMNRDDPKMLGTIKAAETRLAELKSIQENIGKDFSISGVFNGLMNFIRWRGLGFNLPSGFKNVIEGQISNSITAAKGTYFPTEYLNEITLSEMIMADSISKTSMKRMPKNAALIKALMEHYDVLQDASNELQKSSAQSRFRGLSRFNPFYMLQKGEYYNQSPLLAAVLKNTPITSSTGGVSNVKDAMEAIYDSHSKKWTARLIDEFRTPENIASWEHTNGKDYFDFKNKIREVIKETHGDFDPLSGMKAKSHHLGQALIMFKTWLPREVHRRIAIEQDNLATGTKDFKGIYKSHTPASAAMQGAIIGGMAFGPAGALVTGTLAGIGVTLKIKGFGTNSALGFAKELILVNQLLIRKLIGIPVNPIARLIRKDRGNFMDTDREKEYARMASPTFTKRDYENFRSNMQDMAMMFAWFGALLLTKAFLWDDDDDEEDTRRQAHNLLANEFMGLSDQAASYASLPGMAKTVTDMGLVRFGLDASKTVAKLQGLTEGNDMILSGPHKGESAFLNQAQKTVLPGIAHSAAGFGKQTERQYTPSPVDHYFWGEEKNSKRAIQMHKILFQQKMREQFPDLDDDAFDKLVNKQFGKKHKNETYKQFLERVKAREEATQ